tara:strand:- start:5020 stop:5346 length:327 start_codon:yes stop_codon:yes gene_type:complete
MTKEQYLRMCEQTGEEIDWDKCPPDSEDFPNSTLTALSIFNTLGDRVGSDVGYIGKDFTNFNFILDNFYITEKAEKDWIYELILFLERRAIEDSRKKMKAEYDKIKKK